VKVRRDDASSGPKEPTSAPTPETGRFAPSPTDSRPEVAIVGAGAVGTALGVALSRAGWPVAAVVSRDATRRERFRTLVPEARAFIEPAALPNDVGLIILAVPDDAIAGVAAQIRLRSGQILVHTSGLLGVDALEVAGSLAAPDALGALHPLVSFTSDVERSLAGLHGATIAIEGGDRVAGLLADVAVAIGGAPLRLPPGSKPAYHTAAVMASGGLVALLDAVAELGAVAGLDEATSLEVFGRLTAQTLANIIAVGLATALTGPITRGDAGTVAAHIAALETAAPGVVELYVATARRELRIAEDRGALSPDQAARVGRVLAKER
jgi:predicted short-subunit dehydrogenase-like oxidoreductase (DUF2520 family)